MDDKNRNKITLHVFDVDGTLTHNDSLLMLLHFLYPSLWKKLTLCLSVAPAVWQAISKRNPALVKEAFVCRIWKGRPKSEIFATGKKFFNSKLKEDVRKNALHFIEMIRYKDTASGLVLLSASCTEWLQPLANYLQADLICTELEYDEQQRFTGRFSTTNCKGPEKVNRLLEKYSPDRYEFVCYGNSNSDKHLQSISKQFFYRYF